MAETRVVNLRKEKYDVYIGRAGKGKEGYFGNPFSVGKDGNKRVVLEKYEAYFRQRLVEDGTFRARVHMLKGKTLGCFCKPQPCHGDVIVQYLEHEVRE